MLTLYDPFDRWMLSDLLEEAWLDHCEICATDLMEALGYDDRRHFEEAIEAALKGCRSLHVPARYHIRRIFRFTSGGLVRDYILSRFAVYLITMNADPSYPAVAQAQLFLMRHKLS